MKKILASMMMIAVLSVSFVGASGVINEQKVEAAAATSIYVKVTRTSQIQYGSLYVTVSQNGYTYRGTVYNTKAAACYSKNVTDAYYGWVYR
ncbi:hypothetical protein BMT55_02595 [Listeria newyorkensis]|uniref:Lactococcin 972 family bacteriocin n=1 Tax=Listeria newyorkensis TaxID=1497681 RepID=A0ABX4XR44_9LIST|nr:MULTISPECIES: hypothetical protein [Listeria]KGL42124.1 hypothetical protein EP56_10330 [Listeriaceae bacterium FSL A5-0209]KGL38282.1 hypothetical protein EP58_16115 [Listeria newyorkensis]PNP94394.1 hypothetical protein BMT55_02595 [Listeria newyorkensis]RQW67645.1 hypothetical protein DUK53_04825 [Listeria sp. SHR_NRA_18]WAO22805.1 hypothetical protein OTR81_05910 [Listeria newyorkensis]